MTPIENIRFLFVHGLASKPPKEKLHELWARAFIENLSIDRSEIGDYLRQHPEAMVSAYWANCIPDHIEDSAAYVRAVSKRVDAVIEARKSEKNNLHFSKGGLDRNKKAVKRFGISLVNALSRALRVKDDVIENNLREVRLYKNDQYIADRIRAPLESALREAWTAGKEVVLISHSMGTFISYDVLWRFSHRSEDCYRSYRKYRVKQLITMGSPLGDETLRTFMLTDRWKNAVKEKRAEDRNRYFPLNIDEWYNFSALGDVVCHDSTLDDDFFRVMKEAVSRYKTVPFRDYVSLYNPYTSAAGEENPHKSFGYLIQPKLSQKVLEIIKI